MGTAITANQLPIPKPLPKALMVLAAEAVGPEGVAAEEAVIIIIINVIYPTAIAAFTGTFV